MAGALGNALGQMVANLTIGKKRYADVEDEIKGLLARMEDLQKEFVILADRDEEVFAPLAAAYGLPTGTEEEKAHKAAVMEQRLLDASYVPLEVMEKSGGDAWHSGRPGGQRQPNGGQAMWAWACSCPHGAPGAR